MSGGHFDYKQYAVREIADRIEHDIAWALAPKPALVHDDYWSITTVPFKLINTE